KSSEPISGLTSLVDENKMKSFKSSKKKRNEGMEVG
ncbi:MAG: NADH-quinone oxidoreductase subunit E, partial [Bartonella sp.]|nr:NADH-quinone oxidoreductase subunit E [Bartonella sp.]